MAEPQKQVFRLEDMVVEEVSLVDRAANKQKFLIVKRDNSMPNENDITDLAATVAAEEAEAKKKAEADAAAAAQAPAVPAPEPTPAPAPAPAAGAEPAAAAPAAAPAGEPAAAATPAPSEAAKAEGEGGGGAPAGEAPAGEGEGEGEGEGGILSLAVETLESLSALVEMLSAMSGGEAGAMKENSTKLASAAKSLAAAMTIAPAVKSELSARIDALGTEVASLKAAQATAEKSALEKRAKDATIESALTGIKAQLTDQANKLATIEKRAHLPTSATVEGGSARPSQSEPRWPFDLNSSP